MQLVVNLLYGLPVGVGLFLIGGAVRDFRLTIAIRKPNLNWSRRGLL